MSTTISLSTELCGRFLEFLCKAMGEKRVYLDMDVRAMIMDLDRQVRKDKKEGRVQTRVVVAGLQSRDGERHEFIINLDTMEPL